MQRAFYFDQTRCTGCFACVVACKDWHDLPAGPASWMRVTTIERGQYPHPFVAFMASACYHCGQPACLPACPAQAITKREEDGIVLVDRGLCLGKERCDRCLSACPYQAPQFGAEKNPRMQKCDFCLDRWMEEKLPVCVAACPMRALDAGFVEDIESRHGKARHAVGFTYRERMEPAVVFKPKPENMRLPI